MSISEAREFVESRVLRPALANPGVSEKAKRSVDNTVMWLSRFERIGDLVAYMDRFQGSATSEVYASLKSAGIPTFEDIHSEFMSRFGDRATERTRLDDFVVGRTYSSHQIVIPAEVYDTRSGGILPIGNKRNPRAVFIKATLSGGKYANKWLSDGDVLKYYLKSRKEVFRETYIENAAIIEYPTVPIFAFVRHREGDRFTLAGIFRNARVHTETDGSKWFELHPTSWTDGSTCRTQPHSALQGER